MESETWIALVGSTVGAVMTAVVAVSTAVINAKNMKAQRKAEDERFARAYEQQVETHARERRAALADEQAERLRVEAAEFITVLGEAWTAAYKVYDEATARHEKGQYVNDTVWAAWTSDLTARLAVVTAKMIMYPGDVAKQAEDAKDKVQGAVSNVMVQKFKMLDPSTLPKRTPAADIKAFTVAVAAERARILEESFEAGSRPVD